MKIVVAADNYPPRFDGVSRFLMEILPALHKEHKVHVLAPDYGQTDDPWAITKIPISRVKIGDFHLAGLHFLRIYNRIKQADVVFLQALGTIGGLALIAAKLARKRVVLYTHSIEWELVPMSIRSNWVRRWLPDVMKKIVRYFFTWIDLLLMPSHGVSETYYWNKIENKRVVVPLGVDTKSFKPPRSKKAAKKKIGLPEDSFVIGYHGRLAREKDMKTLLRGYVRFARQHPELKPHLLVVGDGLREVRRTIEEREDATITGFTEDVVPYLQAMDVYAISSQTETSCLAVMEAMSVGLPVVSTPVGYVSDYIKDGKNGLLFPQQDSVTLSRKLVELIDPDVRSIVGKQARKTMVERFDWDKTRKQILQVFNQL